MKGINVFLADGFEDIEAIATCDILRRGGIKVTVVSISDSPEVKAANGTVVKADALLKEIALGAEETTAADYMIFPGGMPGASNLAACEPLVAAMKAHFSAGGSLAAICAAPGVVLSHLDSVRAANFTCYEGFQGPLKEKGWQFIPDPSVVFTFPGGNHIVTGRSPGHALTFAYDILETLVGEEKTETIREQMYLL